MSALSPSVIVLLVIIGAGAAVAIGFAISHLFHGQGTDVNLTALEEQKKYMRDVRARNYEDFWGVARFLPKHQRAS